MPEPDLPAPLDLAQAQSQDLEYLGHFFEHERSYSDEASDEARAQVEVLKQRAGKMSPAEFDLEAGRVVALADNGHSNVFASSRSRRFGRVDVRTNWFEDGLYVLRATQVNRELLGLRLVAINGINIEDYAEAFEQYYGGTSQYKRDMSTYFIEAPELLAAAGFPVTGKSATYQLETEEGALVERDLTAGDPDPEAPRIFPHEWMFTGQKKDEENGLLPALLLEEDDLPLYLRRDRRAFIRERLPDIDSYYIQLRQNYNSETEKIGSFLKKAIREIEEMQPRNIVLDVRFNGGGDYTTTARHVKKLPGLIPAEGKVFLISGSETFSAGMSTMGFVKQVAPERVVIVGTEPGDRLQFWSEGNYLTLPNSKVHMRFSTGYVDMEGPCDDYSKCFWIGAFFPIEVDSLSPDMEIPTTFVDYMSGVDPVMDWIARRAFD